MIRRFQLFLGPQRFRWFVVLLGTTGLLSLILNAFSSEDNTLLVFQTLLLIIFLIGAAYLIGGRMQRVDRWRWLAIVAPAVGMILLGILVVPQFAGLLLGGSIGWLVAGWFLFVRFRPPQKYRDAVKAMRKNDYETAVSAMTDLIKEEPSVANHYRFRAELLRLWGKSGRAKRDYRKMIELEPESPVAYNGLAEVYLQTQEYPEALEVALKASELAPDDWVAHYNVGMIQDRLYDSAGVHTSLERALDLGVSDSRHRLLIQLYLLRATLRDNKNTDVDERLAALKAESSGLEEWQLILESDQATVLQDVLGTDIDQAEKLLDGTLQPAEVK